VGRTLLSAAFAFAVALDFALALGQEDLASEDLPSEDSDQPDWDQKGKIKPSQANVKIKNKNNTNLNFDGQECPSHMFLLDRHREQLRSRNHIV
jgi:hypothetical protein